MKLDSSDVKKVILEDEVEQVEDYMRADMLVPFNANKAMYDVLAGDGASKGNDRWKSMNRWVYCWKAIKHILLYLAGVARDKDSREHPLAHTMARCALIIEKDVLDG